MNERILRNERDMNIYVVRHGETLWNKEEVFRGRKDVPLNDAGELQAQKVGRYFADVRVNALVSSPLQRAVQTVQPISATTGIPFDVVEAFTDIDFGIWEGMPLLEVQRRYPVDFDTWKTSPQKFRVENGEDLRTVRRRVSAGLARLFGDGGTVVIVTHRVICKIIVLSCLAISNEHFWDMKYDPASVTLLQGEPEKLVLTFSNDTCHLREAGGATSYIDF
jgi:broad specificity phosphatase PhoE